MKVVIKPVTSEAFSVELPSGEEATVADLKEAASTSGAGAEASRIKLVFRGHVLDGEKVSAAGAFFFPFFFFPFSLVLLFLPLSVSFSTRIKDKGAISDQG